VINPNCELSFFLSFEYPAIRSLSLMFLYLVFGANFDKISATAYYPTKPDDAIGGGTLNDVKIPKNSK